MPPLNARQKAFKNRSRNENNQFVTVNEVEDRDDWIIDGINLDEVNARIESEESVEVAERNINNTLSCNNSNLTKRKGIYQGVSTTTKWRRKKEQEKVRPEQTLMSFGITVQQKPVPEKKEMKISAREKEITLIREKLGDLQKYVSPVMNKQKEGNKRDTYNNARYLSVKYYFMKRLEGVHKGEAAKAAAILYWPDNSEPYRAATIIKWVKEFLDQGKLSDHQQGAHVKRSSLLSDSDVKLMILEKIKQMPPAERSLVVLKKYIDEEAVPSVLGVKSCIPISTIANYMVEWGYSYRKNKKTVYFDGHEREDVVAYRNEWSKRMINYMRRSDFYSGEKQEAILEPKLNEGESKIVFVTHDECTFYANDGKYV